eukprot:TRINITY_DN732_c0_g5_i1.p1 TRINITY_DN732_c0_g5~~TRINITY_DN732_c0_g5_i1.p1  ORF type:complete len:328 (+),score=102.61 TRINITY_DN732_c0_g5_i1:237-1220(+)
MEKYKVKNFPSILIMSPANDYQGILYRGEAGGEAYASALRLHTGYAPIRLGSLDSLFKRANVLMESFVLGVFEDEGELYTKFINASSNLRFIRFYFLALEKNNDTEKTNRRENSVYIVHNPFFTEYDNESQMMLFDSKKWNNTLDSFILRFIPNTVEICTQQTIKIYRIQHKSYMAFFMQVYDDLNTTRKVGKELTELMKKYEGRVRVCLSSSEEEGVSNELIGTQEGAVAIFELNSTMYHGEDMLEKTEGEFKIRLRSERLGEWVKKYLDGKLEPIDMEKRFNEVKAKRMKADEEMKKTNEEEKKASEETKSADTGNDTRKAKIDL